MLMALLQAIYVLLLKGKKPFLFAFPHCNSPFFVKKSLLKIALHVIKIERRTHFTLDRPLFKGFPVAATFPCKELGKRTAEVKFLTPPIATNLDVETLVHIFTFIALISRNL